MTIGKGKRVVKKTGKNQAGERKAREFRTVALQLSASRKYNHLYQLAGRLDPESACWMTELGEIFAELGISHYLSEFVEQGFDSWDTILDITESDFDALGVKLGHRRKLQRRIANSRGLSSDRALASPARNTPVEDRAAEEHKQSSGTRVDTKDGSGSGPQGAKRKYRRHPKPDENAPERPPSAYVIFSNKMREELKGRNLSFTEIAKLVGENWQSLTPGEKEPYEQQAFTDKERYNNQLVEYKKTPQYKEYSQYLAEFKARQSNQQQVTDLDAKRPKLEPHPSTGSSGTGSSVASQHGGDTPTGRVRVESSASATGQWPTPDQPSPKSSALSGSQAASTGHSPPNLSSPVILPGYRESKLFAASHQSLPSREGQPSQHLLPRINSVDDRRLSQPGPSNIDPLNLAGSHLNARRTMQPAPVHPPPLLASESTNRSTGSSSTNSSAYYSPRTPMEPAVDRPLSIPSLYTQKSYENQLPPIRPSLSPQAPMHPQLSPNGVVHPFIDHPNSMAPMRGYAATSSKPQPTETHDERLRDYGTLDDNNLDPVSALLKAGEIVNRRQP